MRQRPLYGAVWAFVLGALSFINPSRADTLWVDATRLVLRTEARSDSNALGYLVANTEVQREKVQGEWCQVRAGEHSGFVACRFLASLPLRRDVLRERLKQRLSNSERLEVLQKLFWIRPSIDLLYEYGQVLDVALLTEDQRAREIDTRQPRPVRPEFEAMKARVLQGVELDQVSLPSGFPPASPRALMMLPRVKSSAFGADGPVTLIDFLPGVGEEGRGIASANAITGVTTGSTIEILTWLAGGRSKPPALVRPVRFGPPQAQHYGGFVGAWDIGGIEYSLPAPGVEALALGRDGSTQHTTITAFDTREANPGIGCEEISQFLLSRWNEGAETKWLAALLNPGSTAIQAARAVARSKPPTAGGWARAMLDRVITLGAAKDAVAIDGSGFMVAFDLNGDAVPDVAYLGFEVSGELLGGMVFDQYFNLSGRWHLTGEYTPQVCGC